MFLLIESQKKLIVTTYLLTIIRQQSRELLTAAKAILTEPNGQIYSSQI
jgi:hypothetical protein